MNGNQKYWILIAAMVAIIFIEGFYFVETNLMDMQFNPEITPVAHNTKSWTFEWDGGNETLTIVNNGGNLTIPVTFREQFTCDKSTNIYEDNRIIFQVP
jgi:predicted NAD/FAD-dependent oxidoreductase